MRASPAKSPAEFNNELADAELQDEMKPLFNDKRIERKLKEEQKRQREQTAKKHLINNL